MGLFSSSKKKTSIANTSQTGEVDLSTGIGATDNQTLALSNVTGNASLTVNESSLDARDAAELIEAVTGGNRDFITATAEALSKSPSADIARSVSGAESEAGRLANKFAVPVIVLASLFLIFRPRK